MSPTASLTAATLGRALPPGAQPRNPHQDDCLEAAQGAASAAHEALSRPWHLAVVAGPDAGLVLPLPERGTIGRCTVLTDPAVSRSHLRVGARPGRVLLSDAGSANGTSVRRGPFWLPLGHRPRTARAGTRLRLGRTELELRRRPVTLTVTEPPSPAQGRWLMLLPVLTIVIMAALVVVGIKTGSRSTVGALVVVPMLVMAVSRLVPALSGRRGRTTSGRAGAGWSGPRARRPDPPSLLLAAAVSPDPRSGPARSEPGTQVSGVRAWPGRRRRRGVLTVLAGDRVALRGTRAADALRWWTAQVIARGAAEVTVGGRAGQPEIRLEWGESSRRWSAEVMAVGCDHAPARARTILTADRNAPDLSPRWWNALLAGAGLGGTGTLGIGAPPGRLSLEDVTGDLDREAVAEAWAAGAGKGLEAVVGVGAQGACKVDLVTDGPHVLMAGTTGSGKSELLISWLLQLALAAPPSRLSLVLVDYKGGAAFGPLERLPHTAGVLTDLDPASTARALSSLHAEVRRRERLLAGHGVKDVGELDPSLAPARLVVVVDEFATLSAEHPEVLDALVRVAAQGRSLGIHLLLATQRPAGAVSPMIRANTTLRVCLRVLDPADSRDVLGHDGAARLDPVPGRVLVAGASLTGESPLQAPWCGSSRHLEVIVAEVTAAARDADRPWRPWAPPLPSRVGRREARRLAAADEPPRDPQAVLLALTDLSGEQRLSTWSWSPWDPLLVLGAPSAGRTTSALSAAGGALEHGVHVQLCVQGVPPAPLEPGGPGVGTVVGPADPRRLARLWTLAATGGLRGSLLVIDDVEAMTSAVDEVLGPAEGQALLDRVVRSARATGTGLLVTAPLAAATSRWAAGIRTRLVLGACHPAEASLAGLPRGVVTGTGAGRGVVVEGAVHTPCQVVLPEPVEAAQDGPPPLRLQPLPVLLAPRPGVWAVAGDTARPLGAPSGPVLVVGPPGSGRSTALRALDEVVTARDGAGAALVIDDLDLAPPAVHAQVDDALAHDRLVLASASTTAVAGTYRGPVATLKERGTLVVLWPGMGPAQQVAGVSLRAAVDPRGLTRPGCGVLVERGRVEPVQVACAPQRSPDSGSPGADARDRPENTDPAV